MERHTFLSMGQLVSKIYGSALREAKMYNIEKRAEKVISKDKPIRAPMHPSSVKELDRLKEGKCKQVELLIYLLGPSYPRALQPFSFFVAKFGCLLKYWATYRKQY